MASKESGLRPLGLNRGGYCGETIDAAAVVDQIVSLAQSKAWQIETLPIDGDLNLYALHYRPARVERRFYLSTGIHGDEPAGPLSIQSLFEQDVFPDDAEFWVLPCLNPTGFSKNQRLNADGIDLNRDFREPRTLEVRALVRWLADKGRFDCAVCLHEDWEAKGFYLYEVNPKGIPCVGQAIVQAVSEEFPIDLSENIEGFAASGGIIHPPYNPAGRPEWPESIFLAEQHAELGYTLETASDYALPDRVNAMTDAVKAMMNSVGSL